MRKLQLWFALVLLTIVPSSAAQMKFDLICETIQVEGTTLSDKHKVGDVRRFAVDLTSGKWACKGDNCNSQNVLRIYSFDDEFITLWNEKNRWEDDGYGFEVENKVNRRTGVKVVYRMEERVDVDGIIATGSDRPNRKTYGAAKAECKPAKFSGLPAQLF